MADAFVTFVVMGVSNQETKIIEPSLVDKFFLNIYRNSFWARDCES